MFIYINLFHFTDSLKLWLDLNSKIGSENEKLDYLREVFENYPWQSFSLEIACCVHRQVNFIYCLINSGFEFCLCLLIIFDMEMFLALFSCFVCFSDSFIDRCTSILDVIVIISGSYELGLWPKLPCLYEWFKYWIDLEFQIYERMLCST